MKTKTFVRETVSELLKKNLIDKKSINPRFSLRAYARLLDIPVASLSQIMAGKRSISVKNALKIADAFEYSPAERSRFLESAVNSNVETIAVENIDENEFSEISEWYYYAILSLWQLKDSQNSPKWIAKKLGISEWEAKLALRKLLDLKHIAIKDASYTQTSKPLRTKPVKSSSSIRKFHRQMVEKSLLALESEKPDRRTFSNMTFSVKKSDLPKLNQRIAEFLEEFGAPVSQRNRDDVYALNVQLFPLTRES